MLVVMWLSASLFNCSDHADLVVDFLSFSPFIKLQNNQDYSMFSSIIDPKLASSFTVEGMEEFIQLIVRCVDISSERRPAMSYVMMELDRMLEKERSLTTVMVEGMPNVTLGSQLFRTK